MSEILAGVGHATDDDSTAAGRRAARAARDDLGGEERIAYAFGSSEYDQTALLGGIEAQLDCPVVGCSTAGEIAHAQSYTESVVVLALAGDGIHPGVGSASGFAEFSRKAGMEAASAAMDDLDDGPVPTSVSASESGRRRWYPKLLVNAFGPGLTGSKEWALIGVQDALGWAHVSGGFAGDDWKLDSTWIYRDGEPVEDSMAVAAMDVDVKTGIGVANGLRETEHTFTVTSAEDNRLYELDDRPALEAYRDRYGDRVTQEHFLMTHPLGTDDDGKESHIAIITDVDEETGSMIVGEKPLEEGQELTVMDTSADAVLDGVETAVDRALTAAGGPDDIAAVLVFDCNCRWYHLSNEETRNAEIDIVRERVGPDVPVAGFYSYGEIATPNPLWNDDPRSLMRQDVHHQSIAIEVITNESL
ncbi:FIST C-terminal domain-containing protein [Haloterrigena salifodinae]|uniref:FIST C-terminal domain-containing protein n=1 Tax=Haloterrigena salifodinae TaxID=2675099 RepID=A0A8T8E610_9EURY|nr:FIST N-terminal domain-containing protein [Haloterrigena salifodinae]QRV17179.1 FIST C-terminal domain-containing protein [Haloterrigena salifodinae]